MRKRFFLYIVLPSFLAIGLFLLSIFVFILPSTERNIMEEKKLMLSELTNTVCSLIEEYAMEVGSGSLPLDSAQSLAIERVSRIRYGDEQKDYFWIIDQQPVMIMHPYRPELNGTLLNNYQDPNGKLLFVESAALVADQGSGYIDYMWQWQDDSSRIVPKLSYVRAFDEWGWIVGTGIYLEDVREDIAILKIRLLRIIMLIALILGILLAIIIWQSLQIEHRRRDAEHKLKLSREKYKSLVEASTEGTLMFTGGKFIFSNIKFSNLSGYSPTDLSTMKPADLMDVNWNELIETYKDPKRSISRETMLYCKDGSSREVIVSVSQVNQGGKPAYILILKEITPFQRLGKDFGKLSEELQSALLLLDNQERSLEEEIADALDIEQLRRIYQRLPVLVKALTDSGANTGLLTHSITRLADTLGKKVVQLAESELGPPPCPYAFLVLGSGGRGEQTLATDQDNAIIYDDSGDEKARKYFENLGKKVSDNLHQIGYQYCKGDIMAKNPTWVQKLETWKGYFSKWITSNTPQDVLDAAIFFDQKTIYGNPSLTAELRTHIHEVSDQRAVFFFHMAQSVLRFKPQTNLLNAIAKGNEDTELDIKQVLLPVVSFVRLYSIREKLTVANSTQRINTLEGMGIVDEKFATQLRESLEYLTRIRIRSQVDSILKMEEPDNMLRHGLLSELELATMKKLFNYISGMQLKITNEFKGAELQ